MKSPLTASMVILSIFISSCTHPSLSTKSSKNHSNIPADWISFDANASQSNPVVFWAKSFDNPWLNEAILTAWSSNYELAAQAEQTLARGEEAVIMGADLFPKANIGISGSRSKRNLIGFNFPNGSTSFTSESFDSGINLSWEVDLWGKFRKQREAAEKRFEIAKIDYEAFRLSIAGKVAKLWFEIVERNQQLELSKQTVDTFQKNKDFVTNRFRNGLANALDNDMAESAHASSQATFSSWSRLSHASKRNFQSLLGKFPDEGEEHNFSTILPQLNDSYSPPTPAQALANRPDMQSAKLQLEAAGLDLESTRLNLLPSLNISGGPGSRADQFEDLLDNKFRTWQVGGNLSAPLFQGGRIKAQIRRSDALKQSALANYKATALRAFHEVEKLLFQETQLQIEQTYLENATKAAKSVAQLSWDRYKKGIQGIFDTLESQRRLFDAESRLLVTRKERIINRINLYLALGIPALSTEP